jgi:hypothetical protein
MIQFFQRACFAIRHRYFTKWVRMARNMYYKIQGMQIGQNTYL